MPKINILKLKLFWFTIALKIFSLKISFKIILYIFIENYMKKIKLNLKKNI